jgi:[ribosomal protein S5]-alanine N-acetyltransferase
MGRDTGYLSGIERDTGRLHLRPLRASDASEFVRVHDESQAAWEPWTPLGDPDVDLEERFRRELTRAAQGLSVGTHLRLGAFADDELVGLFSLNEIVMGAFESAYASWQVAVSRMGQGYGREGVLALLDIAFTDAPVGVGLHRVQANVMPANGRSLRLASRVGFRREGVAARYLRIAGAWEEHVMHAITREEWLRSKE